MPSRIRRGSIQDKEKNRNERMNTKKKNKGCIKIQGWHHGVRSTGGTDATGSNNE